MNTKEIEKTDNTVTEQPVKKTTKKAPKEKVAKVEVIKESPIKTGMGKLENAYNEAISGKIKFKEVRNIFEKLHKEIKNSVKKAKK